MINLEIAFIFILYIIILITLYNKNKSNSQLLWNRRYQSYMTDIFFKYNRGFAFYDKVHLGVYILYISRE